MPVELCASERAMYPSRRVYRATLLQSLNIIGWKPTLDPTREPTKVTTRNPAVGYNPGWVDPPVTALDASKPVRQAATNFPAAGLTLPAAMPASGEPLPARHGRAPIPFLLSAISPHGNLPSAGTHPWLFSKRDPL
jgi:hypothetical protein